MSTATPTALLRRFRFDERYRIIGDLDLWRQMAKADMLQVITVDEPISVFEYGDGLSSMPKNNAIKWVENLMSHHAAGQKFTTVGLVRQLFKLLRIELVSRLPIGWRLRIWKMRHGWRPLEPGSTNETA